MSSETIRRRTFEALRYPKDDPIRAHLNENPITSEYMRSYKFTVGTRCFVSRREAELYLFTKRNKPNANATQHHAQAL